MKNKKMKTSASKKGIEKYVQLKIKKNGFCLNVHRSIEMQGKHMPNITCLCFCNMEKHIYF